MSSIQKMSIQGIRSFGPDDKDKQIIQFFAPLTLILGPNGTGKTTIIECLRYMTTGEMPPGSTGTTRGGNAFIHDPKIAREREVKAQVKLQLTDVMGKQVVVTRSMAASQKEKRIVMSTLEGAITRRRDDGTKVQVTSRCAEINREMISALGVSLAVLDNVIFCHQEESNWPLSAGKDLKQKFDDIFASTRYVKALECIRKTRKEQADSLKLFHTDIKYLKQNKEKAQEIKRSLEETQVRYEAAKQSVARVTEELKPIEKKLEQINMQATDIMKLQTKIGNLKTERLHIEKSVSEIREGLEEEFTGSLEELKRAITQHCTRMKDKEDVLSQMEQRLEDLAGSERKLNKEQQDLLVVQGGLAQEAERHQANVAKRDAKVAKVADEYSIQGYGGSLRDDQVHRFLRAMKEKCEAAISAARDTREEFDKQVEELQAKMDDARDSKTKLESSLKMKQDMVRKNREEVKDINQQLSRVDASAGRLDDIRRELKQIEHELEQQERSINVDGTKAEINNLQRTKRELEGKLGELSSELTRMTNESSVRAQLDMLRKDKSTKEDQIRRLKAKNEENLLHLLLEVPSENLKRKVDDYIRSQMKEVAQLQKNVRELTVKQTSKNTDREHFMATLRKKETELRELEDKIYRECESQNFEEGMERLQQKKGDLMDQKGALLASQRMFNKYIKNLGREDPPCPLCHRPFDNSSEVDELIEELREKLDKVPERVAKAERDYDETETKFNSLMMLRPVQAQAEKIKTKEIPELKEKLTAVEAQISQLKSELNEKEEDLTMRLSDEAMAKSMLPDLAAIERFQNELRDVDRKIATQAAKLSGGDTARTIQEVNAEKDEIQMQLDTNNRTLEHKRQKLSDHSERVNTLKTNINELKRDQLQIESDLQRRTGLEERKVELQAQSTTYEREIEDAKDEIAPLQGKIEKLRNEREQLDDKKEAKYEADVEQINRMRDLMKDINSIHKEIDRYVQAGKEEQLQETAEKMRKLSSRIQEMEKEMGEVMESVNKLRKDLASQQVKERELQDNLQLRRKEEEIDELCERIQTEEKKLGGLDASRLERDRRELRDQQDALVRQRHTAEGRKGELETQIRNYTRELQSEQYRNAEEAYRSKMIDLKTTELASTDLEKYYKALDHAIMRYHNLKMEELNKIIRHLWRNTYKGNDIDTIEIKSDEDEGSGAAKNRRVYNYRVQMLKGDIPIDMRGRCSAGQKVLASLIIRLALAETFCINCGILALDEPTTNLDRENIESLAVALVDIIKNRSQQHNFQLVIITHDEDFVDLLGRSDYVDEFWKVRKNVDGCSELVRAKVSDLHTR